MSTSALLESDISIADPAILCGALIRYLKSLLFEYGSKVRSTSTEYSVSYQCVCMYSKYNTRGICAALPALRHVYQTSAATNAGSQWAAKYLKQNPKEAKKLRQLVPSALRQLAT